MTQQESVKVQDCDLTMELKVSSRRAAARIADELAGFGVAVHQVNDTVRLGMPNHYADSETFDVLVNVARNAATGIYSMEDLH